ncbi:type II secretion system F family protein [Mycobacterium sherrisii]|uniref:type II secretion system F family protein n=1 Tax=Mycobacterium sherrisii TaxID=243061 RepID=UPI002DDD9E2C|nr:type II secretion system F family protein [Mycobacterium sherrisii]MEC4763322.1 type II secretion system F family protein [Mycobacterium sherrisii]
MSGVSVAALCLALALLLVPSSRGRRLDRSRPSRRPLIVPARAAGWLPVCGIAAGAAMLPVTVVLAGVVVAATASLRLHRKRRIRRSIEEGRTLEAALDVLVGELRVGNHPVRAFAVAADETTGPVAAALRGVAARARLGADVTAGLRTAARTSAQPAHWHRLAVCWQLASEYGLAIATLMRTAQRDIVERQRFSARVSSGLAGARATAAILAGLPVLGVVLGQLIGARPLSFLFGGHVGGWLLLAGSLLACAGLLWSDRIIQRAGAGS